MKNYLAHKADFQHKLGIKFYMISLTLLLVNQFPNLGSSLGNLFSYFSSFLFVLFKKSNFKKIN